MEDLCGRVKTIPNEPGLKGPNLYRIIEGLAEV
jgi:hypothetical protein